jgi:2-dehydropantoate 2-reductase
VKILVFGAGAMGSLIGGRLSSRNEVTLVARPDHVRAIRRCGLRITGKTEMVSDAWAMTEAPRDRQDLVIVSTKAYDTASSVRQLRRFWPSSLFLTLQNGLRNADIIAARADRAAAGTTSHGVTFVREGVIRHAGLGDTYLGTFKKVTAAEVRELCREFTACGFPATFSDDIRRDMWMKAIVNAAINPLTAICKVENGRLLRIPQLRALMRQSCEEAAAVARAEGQQIQAVEATRITERVALRTAANRSSMLQDIERGRRTEVSQISGAIAEAAVRRGIPLPVVNALRLSVSELERHA